MRNGLETGIGQHLRHQGKDAAHVLDVPAQVLRPIEIDEKELRGVMKASAFEEVPMGLRKTRGLPAAQQHAPFSESRVLGEPGAQLRRAVELGKQQVMKALFRHKFIFYTGRVGSTA